MILRPAASLFGIAAIVLASSSPALGQQSPMRVREAEAERAAADLKAQKAELNQRNRGVMHPGEALTIVGIEEGGNDIRSRTPALANSDRAAAVIDPDESYHRALALYTDGARFQSAPPTVGEPKVYTPKVKVSHPVEAQDADSSKGPSWIWALGGVTSAIFGAWGYRRFVQRS